MAAEEAGQFVYVPAEEGGDTDPVAMDHSGEPTKPAGEKTPSSLPKSPASPSKTHVRILSHFFFFFFFFGVCFWHFCFFWRDI